MPRLRSGRREKWPWAIALFIAPAAGTDIGTPMTFVTTADSLPVMAGDLPAARRTMQKSHHSRRRKGPGRSIPDSRSATAGAAGSFHDPLPSATAAVARTFFRRHGRQIAAIDVSAGQLKRVVEGQHGAKAVLVTKLPVREVCDGATVWEGTVHLFDLTGHPDATRVYAGSRPVGRSDRRRFFAVLHLGGVRSPRDAVRAALAAERRATGRR